MRRSPDKKEASPPVIVEDMDSAAVDLAARIIGRIGGRNVTATAIPNLSILRFDAPTEPTPYFLEPSVCLILQGRKRLVLEDQAYEYDSARFFVTSIDLPLIAQILEASPSRPYVGILLKLDRVLVAELVMDRKMPVAERGDKGAILELGILSRPLLGAVERLVCLLEEPDSIPILSPLIEKEVYYRLLMSECGTKIRQMATSGSPTHQISRTIYRIKENLPEKLRIEDLAGQAGMSVSTYHHHFRSLTSLSPLQFQKRLRLNEARRRMLADGIDAATAGFEVGYESPSQFNREYSRLFGLPPRRDVQSLRTAAKPGSD